ncbi:ATP-binding cassette domain-containing protein, partial [Mesorhizobium sp. M4B.F.Ca.ET.172.01.1.1]|uniref:ABC transporter ATP-binding protein n=1 Tax=Mesorhizobium sp. M4B.F.Ca.ET.172.01.1.1 TaxID=2563950 RepID=UPI00109341E3
MSHLILDKVSVLYDGQKVPAVERVSLDISKGDFVVLVGRSGSGKTSLLNVAAGQVEPSGGLATVDGRPITGPGSDRAVVFQNDALFPWLTVAENIGFGLREQGRPERERNEIVASYVDLVGLKGFENHWPKQLSGGMQQRTAIAR